MAIGVKLLRKLQFGRETTAGTAAAASTIWRGLGTLEDQRETVFPEEDIGYLSGTDRAYCPKLAGALTLESVEASFEQLPHLFEMGIMTATPVTDTGGSGKIYTYTHATTAAPTLKTYTVEGGDNAGAEIMSYCYAEKITIEGKAGEALKMGADLKGRTIAPTSFGTSATLPAVEEILFSKGTLYIDAVSGTAGTTPVSETLIEMKLDDTTGIIPVYTADGQLYFTTVKCATPEVTIDLTFEHNASAIAEIAAWKAGTPRLLKLKFPGTALTTAGSGYSYKTFEIIAAGKWEKFTPLGDSDGNDIVTGTFRVRYDTTAGKFIQYIVVNELASIP